MRPIIDAMERTGPIAEKSVRSPDLTLVADLEDPPWTVLNPTDASYGLFAWVRDVQDSWSEDQHHAFWRGSLLLWPHKRGPRRHRDLLAGWVHRWLVLGFDQSQIESALHYAPGTLQRMGILRAARAYAEEIAARVERSREEPKFELIRAAAERDGRFLDPEEAAAILYEPKRSGRLLRCPRVASIEEAPAWGLRSVDWEVLDEAGRHRRSETLALVQRADKALYDARATVAQTVAHHP